MFLVFSSVSGPVLYLKAVIFLSNSVWNSQWLLNPSPCVKNERQHHIIMADSCFNHSCKIFLHSKTMKNAKSCYKQLSQDLILPYVYFY